jgi:hypothetical protein
VRPPPRTEGLRGRSLGDHPDRRVRFLWEDWAGGWGQIEVQWRDHHTQPWTHKVVRLSPAELKALREVLISMVVTLDETPDAG